MRTSDLDYPLPPAAIAQHPVEPRDAARLLVDHGPGRAVEHRHVRDLPDLLLPGDLVVVNDTRVLPARLHLWRSTGGAVEVLLLEPIGTAEDVTGAVSSARAWRALVRPSRKLPPGEVVTTGTGESELAVEIGERLDDGETRLVRFAPDADLAALLASHGEMPLPPYITARLDDPERYQTVYAARPASSAAPTAGLHLTEDVFERLRARDIGVERVELVVGLDTFKPIAVDDPADHPIHTESYRVEPNVLARAHDVRSRGGRIVAIGTTAVRALESAATRGPSGRTELFIRRPYEWQVVDVLLTNFHLPRTTLLLLVDAFVGPRWRELYEIALAAGYRFLSFGDAMLLTRAD